MHVNSPAWTDENQLEREKVLSLHLFFFFSPRNNPKCVQSNELINIDHLPIVLEIRSKREVLNNCRVSAKEEKENHASQLGYETLYSILE